MQAQCDYGKGNVDWLEVFQQPVNTRPRATHAFNTPLAVFTHLLATAQQPSTSIH